MKKLIRKLERAINESNPRSFTNQDTYIDFTFYSESDRETFKEYLDAKIPYEEFDSFGYPALKVIDE